MYVQVPSLQVGDVIAVDGDNPDSSDTVRIAKILHEEDWPTATENIKADPDDIVIWFQFAERDGFDRWQQSQCGPKAWLVEEAS
jgi:hypothetical protein|tara:strand:+ start:337 stop:588 length:252 start_codon:yes stop_codon:yes gene_type:complete